ncbi:MAG: signal recognition particle-docking protein FtsY [Rhizobiaceae bacterium]
MAFGFIKKVFSFGKKEVEQAPAEEARPTETAETAAPQSPVAVPEAAAAPPPPEDPAPAPVAERPVEGPVPEFLVTERADPEPAPLAPDGDAPSSIEGPAKPLPALAEPPVQETPPEDKPAEMDVAPAEAAVPPAEATPEPPAAPPPAEQAIPAEPAPSAEIAPPLRQVEPIHPDPLREEIAPEPSPLPQPPRGEVGRVRVGKAVEQAETPTVAPEAPAPAAPRIPWLQRLREGLSRSSRELGDQIAGVFNKRKLDEDTLQDLEDVLIRADLGIDTAMRVTDALAVGRYGKDVADAEVRAIMAAEVEKVLAPVAMPLELDLSHKPHVILVVGVNGTGKTTTIGKLAAKLTAGGLSVMLAAGDTFRAAAIEQLKIWGERTNSPVISSKHGADAAGLAYDAFEKAKAAGSDVLIIDTAGRLQNKAELMAELEKIVRVLGKHDPEAPHTVLQTVDATTGQNALNQVEIFKNIAGVNGLVMTKLDGTARGGILVSIAAKHKLPVYFIGVGEQVDDLEPFSASDFAKAIAGVSE